MFDEKFRTDTLVIGTDYTNNNLTRALNYSNLTGSYYTFGGYFKAGTYTFSINSTDHWYSLNRIAIAGTNAQASTIHIRNSYTWTQNIDGYTYFSIERDTSSTDYTDMNFDGYNFKLQIEQGSTASTYTPHQEQTYTFPLGTQRMYLGDYLADDGIHHVREQVVLDGSSDETFGVAGEGDTTNGFSMYSNYVIDNIKATSTKVLLSNYFRFVARNTVTSSTLNFITGGASTSIVLNIDRGLLSEASVAGFKTWLSNNPITVEYELATEEITPYTTEQQQAYDEIKQAISYEEQTNISGESSEAKPILTVVALKNI